MSSLFNVWLLFYALRRKLKRLDFQVLSRSVPLMAGAAVLAGEVAWLLSRLWERHLGHTSLTLKLGAVFVPMAVAAALYVLAAVVLKVPEAKDMLGTITRKLRNR